MLAVHKTRQVSTAPRNRNLRQFAVNQKYESLYPAADKAASVEASSITGAKKAESIVGQVIEANLVFLMQKAAEFAHLRKLDNEECGKVGPGESKSRAPSTSRAIALIVVAKRGHSSKAARCIKRSAAAMRASLVKAKELQLTPL